MKDYSFGNFLCALRMRRGLSQFQLGTLVGVSNKAVSKWENGASMPQISTCRKLAEVLGVTLDELLTCKYLSSASAGKEVFAMEQKLWTQVYKRLRDVYGKNPPVEMVGRLETEKLLLAGSSLIPHFGFLSDLAEYGRKNGIRISLRGDVGNVFAAWLLGVTDVNPLPPHYLCSHCKTVEFRADAPDGWDLPPKRCACGHMMQPDGHRLPCEKALMKLSSAPGFDINVPEALLPDAERLLREHFEKDAQVVRLKIDHCHKLPDMYILLGRDETLPEPCLKMDEYVRRYGDKTYYMFCSAPMEQRIHELCRMTNRLPDRVDFLAEDVLAVYNRAELPEQIDGLSVKARNPILRKIRPGCFSEILKVQGLQHSIDAWEENQEPLWDKEILNAGELLAFREDVFEAVSDAMGDSRYVGSGFALHIMEQMRKGRLSQNEMPEETEALLMKMGIPGWKIEVMKKTFHLFPRAHGISYLHSEMIIIWFYLHERELFSQVFGK